MTSFLFLRRLCDERMLPEDDPLEPLRWIGIRTEEPLSVSRARVFSDSGGSFMWEASRGRDQSEGVALKNMEGVWARMPRSGEDVLVLSSEVRV